MKNWKTLAAGILAAIGEYAVSFAPNTAAWYLCKAAGAFGLVLLGAVAQDARKP